MAIDPIQSNKNSQAFPVPGFAPHDRDVCEWPEYGTTKYEYAVIHILSGVVASGDYYNPVSYAIALVDTMFAQLDGVSHETN